VNEQQLKLFISQAFALANREAKVVAALEPQLLAAMKRVQDLVASLPPPGDLFRERAWRELQPSIFQALAPYNQQFLNQLQTQLAEEAPAMAAEAVKMLEASGASVPAAQVRTAEAIGRGFPGLNVQDSVRVALESRVNNQRVVDLFSVTPDSPVSSWMRTNQDVINKVVTRGILEGQSTEDIAKGIISVTTRNGEEYVNTQGATATRRVLAEERAIARTAVQDANRQVNEEVFRANEEQLSGLQWEWVAALDSKTCPTCAPLDGQRWDKRSDAPEWPLHVNCVLGDTPIAAGGVIAATRAIYSGDVVTVRTESGRKFSVTAQHPVLTDRGWVRANELGNGLNLITHRERIPSSLDLPDLDNGPSTAAQVFEAFCASPGVVADTVPATPVQFHGDGKAIKGDVEVVWSQRPLQLNPPSELLKRIPQFTSVGTDTKLLFESGFGPTDLLFLWVNAATNGLVSLADECQALLRGECSLSQAHGFAARVRSHPSLFEPVYDHSPAAAHALSDALDALSSFVSRDQVIDIQIEAAHEVTVYDFTTLSGTYSMDQAMGHNCRCRVVAVDPEDAADVRAGLQVSPTRDDLPAGREYKTKLKVKGSKLYRVSTDIKGSDGKPPTYADFLAQSNRTTQQMFFGGGNAGSIRAERFQKAVRSGTRPEVALRDLINRDANGVGRFRPVTL